MPSFASYPSLKGRSVLVSGGGSGIGAGIVEHFAAQGAKVGFVDVDEPGSHSVIKSIAQSGHAAPTFRRCDIRDTAAYKATIAEIAKAIGPIAVLVNNAARDDRHKIDEVTEAFWDERIAVNLRHHYFAAQAVVPGMRKAGGGSIINLSSMSYVAMTDNLTVYQAAKAAVIGMTRGLARDLGGDGIRVNSVMPGWIMTERQIKLWLTPQAEADLMRQQCLKEKLYPADIARMILWLAADDSRLVTAQNFIVDGGRN
ncbi:MAG: SDR family oxidoreductase [Alphaproteobacteria bacterium]|nr:SDR family oxidoreductase [Alphaproteobacteria bacterium]